MTLEETIHALALGARRAARALAPVTREQKDAALHAIARRLRSDTNRLLVANAADVRLARERGTRDALVDRLALDERRLEAIAASVEVIAAERDPVGETIAEYTRPNGLHVRRVRAPLGVIAIVYESRPNVTIDASALCLKAGNAVLLRGGSDAAQSNAALGELVRAALTEVGLPEDCVSMVAATERDAIRLLVQQSGLVDLAIPRGGEALIRFVTDNARVPVVQHYKGVCHLYVDASADLEQAMRIALNAKLSRPGVCNAMECLLIDAAASEDRVPALVSAFVSAGCEVRGCARTAAFVRGVKQATDDDWGAEFLDRVLAVRVVDGLSGALEHIARYGSGHTEAICTKNALDAERFRREVDAACVMVNTSTRFHDGGELGLGAELGIATSRLHWRGPMGVEALTTMKWIVDGTGQIRS